MGEKSKGGRPPRPGGPLKNRLAIKAREEWWDWLRALAEHLDTTPTGVLERGATALAKRSKFDPPPPRT